MGGQIYHLVIDNFPSDFKSVYQIYAVVLILAGCDFAFIISVYRSKEVLGMLKITAVCAKQDVEKTVNQAELFKRQIDIKKIVPAN